MSTVKTNNVQIGQSVTATNNGTWYQPATPDGTIRYGIGNSGATTSDVVTLSSSGLSATALIPSGSTAPTNGMFLPTTNTLAWSTNSTERLRLDSSGNLGLGVTPTASAWPVLQVGYQGNGIWATGQNDVIISSNAYYTAPSWKYAYTNTASYYEQYAGKHIWYTAPSGTAGNAISFTQAMTLDASGNLFVGKTATGLGTAGIEFSRNGWGQFTVSADASLFINRLSSDGAAVKFYRNTVDVGSISVTSSATAYNTSSDERLKTNIAPAGSAIQSILDFPVDQFDWISSGEHQDFGGVAQKVFSIIPEMVSAPTDPDEMWGIDWSKAVPRLIKTIQEMHEEIQTLKQKVNA